MGVPPLQQRVRVMNQFLQALVLGGPHIVSPQRACVSRRLVRTAADSCCPRRQAPQRWRLCAASRPMQEHLEALRCTVGDARQPTGSSLETTQGGERRTALAGISAGGRAKLEVTRLGISSHRISSNSLFAIFSRL